MHVNFGSANLLHITNYGKIHFKHSITIRNIILILAHSSYSMSLKTTLMLQRCSVVLFFLFVIIMPACKEKTKAPVTVSTTPFIIKKDSAVVTKESGPVRPPIVNITDTIARKYIVLYLKDSASTSERISNKLAKIYGTKLPDFINKEQLTITGPPIAWYKTNTAPFFFEAGIPVSKKPAKLPKGFFVRNVGGDSAVIAHFYGPYALTSMGYDAITDYMADNKKKRNGLPYEIYVTEPVGKDGKTIDPYKVQTDIIFPYK